MGNTERLVSAVLKHAGEQHEDSRVGACHRGHDAI